MKAPSKTVLLKLPVPTDALEANVSVCDLWCLSHAVSELAQHPSLPPGVGPIRLSLLEALREGK